MIKLKSVGMIPKSSKWAWFTDPCEKLEGIGKVPWERGWGNGYVIIPATARLHGRDEVYNVDVHGGVTFSENSDKLTFSEAKHFPGSWVVGFDTNHFRDNKEYWTEKRVEEETEYLYKQLVWANYSKLH